MIKVIIADDEEKICRLINQLIDWEALDMEVVAIVHNGIDAVKMIETIKPDIVITDIRMPGYNGLEMIENVKQNNIHSEFIIISGYRHFEYAKRAIKFGVKEYLLKPINKLELMSALEGLRKEYLDKQKNFRLKSNIMTL